MLRLKVLCTKCGSKYHVTEGHDRVVRELREALRRAQAERN